jgi:hypothetical protein
MSATATSLARLAAIAVVVTLAAAAGLVAGNVIQSAEADVSPGAGGAGLPHMSGLDGARFEAIEDARAGTPTFADPYRQIIEAAEAAEAAVDVAEAAYEQYQRIEHDPDGDAFTQTWGNLDERRPAAFAAEEPNESATAPTPR